jgi:hypothetical protein
VGARTDEPGSRPIPGQLKGASHEASDEMAHGHRVVCRHGAPGVACPSEGPGPNGQIAFSRLIEDDNTVTYTANADGSHLQQLFRGFSGGPCWSPDGSQVSIFAACTDGEENCAATIVDPDTGTFRQFQWPDPTSKPPVGGG